jgi:integrase
MGYCKPRRRKNGMRYTAIYLNAEGKERSAGTYDTEKEAVQAWVGAEAKVSEGRGFHLENGKRLFEDYAENDFLPNHVMEATTRQDYTYQLYRHIMPVFGEKRLMDIHPIDIKRWLANLKEAGLSAANRKNLKALLSAIFTSAVDDMVLIWNPCKVVKTDPVPEQPLEIISPMQFDRFYHALPDEMSQMLAETAIETGMRWGELTELRPKDFDERTNIFTVSRAVVMLNSEFHPEGQRFLVKNYPKGRQFRRIKVEAVVGRRIADYIARNNLGDDDLLFRYVPAPRPRSTLDDVDPTKLGRTDPDANGTTYAHGTLVAYTAGKCRCAYCKAAMADYRRGRRAGGKDSPRPARVWETDGHVPGQWFRETVIKPALKTAGLKLRLKMHHLRHAHASWLLNGGADLMVIKARLGHKSIRTTERYLHTLEDADDTALAALNNVRTRTPANEPAPAEARPDNVDIGLLPQEKLLELIGSAQTELTQRLMKQASA